MFIYEEYIISHTQLRHKCLSLYWDVKTATISCYVLIADPMRLWLQWPMSAAGPFSPAAPAACGSDGSRHKCNW